MRYLPHTPEEISEMLSAAGVNSLDDLFLTVPPECRRKSELNLPERLSEWDLNRHIDTLSGTMAVSPEYKVFMGAGSYEHHIPSAVSHLLSRSEFSTSYTPYQPEVSQGTLQAIFEYQTLTTRLLGMEVANASQYDGASALAEATLMAVRVTRKKKVAVSRLVHPHYRTVLETYLKPTDYEIVELPYLPDGTTDLTQLDGAQDLAAVAVQSPNYFGCIENLRLIGEKVQDHKTLFITCFTEPLAYGLFKNPGSQGADIACGEGQSLGIPRSFGGPALGMFAAKMKYVRNMPGRLVGQTTDADGKRGFVLTLATREQHIRRERATSNICTNHSLCALASAMYMATLGGSGMKSLARLNYDKCEYLKNELRKAGFKIPFEQPTFNEFVVEFPPDFVKTYDRLVKQKIIPGLPLECHYRELKNHYLLCVTETLGKEDMDELVAAIKR
ncbi:Glycine dehydrogenase [decarboxylating] (glycine cleavage system P1 protein) (EC [Olavius algarvensis Delta 1 endosymbiont]|nr:Glycine dehydrogenase [decarboxylating] (glycine cleavage system P1 protein) (EC [Olavius algarvensis Delta 1 endosymbiont]